MGSPGVEPGAPPARPAGAGHGSGFVGTTTLMRFLLRRDRVTLPLWVAGLVIFVVYVASAVPVIAATEEELAATALLFESPIARLWVGPAHGMDAVTYERFFAGGYTQYLYILGALMNLLLIVRHTRAEEQSGRAELIRTGVTGRMAPLTAALLVALLTNLVAGALVAGTAIGVGYAAPGSTLIGATLALVGMAWAGVAAVTAQLSESSRAASAMAGALLGVAFLVRGLGDMASPGGSTLSWFSPLGWSLQTAPYVLNHWWPLWLLVALTACSVGVAFLLQSRRDLGIGWLRAGRGRPHARAHLGSPFGLAWRLQRGALLGWAAAIVVFALIDGGFAQTMLDAAAEMPPILTDMFGGTAGLADGYAAFLAEYSGYLAVAHVVFAAHILTGEEQSGRADAVLATPTSRISWAGTHYLVIAMGVVAVLTVAGLASGVAFAAVTADTAMIGTLIAAHLNLVPAVWVMVALMAVLFGWAPRLLTVVGWVAVGMVFFFGLFARIMDLPEWVIGLSPLSHPAQLPVEDFSATPLLVLTLITAAGVGLGLIGLRRRQIMNRA